MQAFSLKRKLSLPTQNLEAFNSNELEQDEHEWMTATKKQKVVSPEDAASRALRLRTEGVTLAADGQFWNAIGKFQSCLSLTPDDYIATEMLAQSYMQVDEGFSAVTICQKAVELKPNWWPGLQTLGRAYLGIGEVKKAVNCFSKGILIKPDEQELWKEDLKWSYGLLTTHKELQEEERQLVNDRLPSKLTIEEVSPDFEFDHDVTTSSLSQLHNDVNPTTNQEYYDPQKDPRFVKSISSVDCRGQTTESKRSQLDLDHMVCFRS